VTCRHFMSGEGYINPLLILELHGGTELVNKSSECRYVVIMECRMQRLYGQWCYKRTEHRMFRSYLRHFGYRSTNAPHTACRIPDRAVRGGSRRGRRAADPGPAQTSYKPGQKSGNGSRSLFVDPALYTVKVRINNNCLLQGMPTRHRYKSCVWSMLYALRMHYVSCSVLGRRGYVGAVWGVASHPSATHVVYFCACA